jgi:hypothetical protein
MMFNLGTLLTTMNSMNKFTKLKSLICFLILNFMNVNYKVKSPKEKHNDTCGDYTDINVCGMKE